ncbi:MAG: HAMP domain-containing sensor histidine kinase [Rhodocyclaceae bacterium]|nr:HAMP domain-containing sensor histidine kinase [Rhodocyclaceae bacterium]
MNAALSRWRLLIPGRLFLKIFVSLWLSIATIALAVDFIVDSLFQAKLRRSPDLSLGFRAELATSLVATTLRQGDREETRRLFEGWLGKRDLPVLVVDALGQDMFGRTVAPGALKQALAVLETTPAELAVQKVDAPDGQSFVLFVPLALLPSSPPHLHVYQYADSSRIEILSMTLASLLFAFGMAWYLFRPIRHLHKASQSFADGALDTRIAAMLGKRNDEFADLARDFDRMAERLQTTIEDKTRLLHDVSHELRSPLTRMQVALEMAQQAPDKSARMLDRIRHEVMRLDRILGDTLTLSRLESVAESNGEKDCVNLVELLEDIVSDVRFEAAQEEKKIVLHASGEILIDGNAALLRSAIENVIRNGMQHTPQGSTVTIGLLAPRHDWVDLRICDSGTGVAPDELNAIFEPFYRGKENRANGGHGLGLSIVRRAIEAHGGKVSADNHKPEGGLCVIMSLPVAQHADTLPEPR